MGFKFQVCHLFYYPSQVILVDDDPNFLDAVSLILPRNLSYRLFQSARQALTHINNAQQHAALIRRVYSSYKTGPFDSDTLTHIDINEIYKEIYNPERFATPSVLVVDYAMPSMNGLELCASLTNPYIKRILLTGQADTEIAVQAFNDGLIDQFISKNDQDLEAKLQRSIASLQQHYFSKSFKLITDPVIANSQSRFINNPEFIAYFNALRETHNIVEYYLLDEPYSAFLMLDAYGDSSVLLVLPEAGLQENLQQCIKVGAPQELITALAQGTQMPLFNISESDEQLQDIVLKDWRSYYTDAHRIAPQAPYFCALLEDDLAKRLLRAFKPDEVQSYDQHINGPAGSTKFLH